MKYDSIHLQFVIQYLKLHDLSSERKWYMSYKKPTKTSDWLLFHSSMARTKVIPRSGWEGY